MLETCCCRGLKTRPPIRQTNCSLLRLNHIAIITCFYTIQHNTPPDLVNYTFCYLKQNLFNCTFFHFYVLLQPTKPKNTFFLTKQQKNNFHI